MNLIYLFVGVWLGFELKKILDNPHQQPETTNQFLENNRPAPKHPYCIYCDDAPLPGRYFCSEHIYHEKEGV